MTRLGPGTLHGVMQKVSHDGNPRPHKKTSSGKTTNPKKKFKPSTIMGLMQISALGGLPLLNRMLSKRKSKPSKSKDKDFKFRLPTIDSRGNINTNLGDQYAPSVDQFGNIDFSSFTSPFKRKSKKDPLFLNNRSENIKDIKKNDSLTDSVGMLYTLFKKIDEQETRSEELRKFQRTEELLDEEKRHAEILDTLESVSPSEKKPKKKPKAGKLKKPKEQPEKVPSTKPTQTPKGTVKPSGLSTASKVAGVGLGATVATGVAAKIARAESAGSKPESYLTMNIVHQKTGPSDQGSSYQVKKGNLDVTTGKPYEKDLTDMTLEEVLDLSNRRKNYFKHSGAGAAAGKYQFMPKTLEGFAKNLTPGSDDWKKIKYTPDTQEILNEMLIGDNAKTLRRAGVPVNDATLYMMHFTGSVEQSRKMLMSPDNTPMKDIMSKAALDANPSYKSMTVGQYREGLKRKGFDFKTIEPEETSRANQDIKPVNTGEQVYKTSSDNKDLKQQTTSANYASLQQNNIVVHGGNKNYVVAAAADDNPAFLAVGN